MSEPLTSDERAELEGARYVLRELDLLLMSYAHQFGLAPEGEWGVIPPDLHPCDKLEKYIMRAVDK
jgi:hypothetical protein